MTEPKSPRTLVLYNARSGLASMTKIVPYALIGIVGLAIAGFLRQCRQPIPTPPRLTFLFENPLVEAFASPELLVERLGLAPGVQVLQPFSKRVNPSEKGALSIQSV